MQLDRSFIEVAQDYYRKMSSFSKEQTIKLPSKTWEDFKLGNTHGVWRLLGQSDENALIEFKSGDEVTSIDKHWHDYTEVITITEGEMHLEMHRATTTYKAHQSVTIPKNIIHSAVWEPNTKGLMTFLGCVDGHIVFRAPQ